MKTMFKRILAALLVAVMIFGSAPIESLTGFDFGSIFNVEAEAASYKVNNISVPIDKWTHKGPNYGNCWSFAQMVYKKLWNGKTFTSYRGTSDDMLRNIPEGDARKINETNAKKYISFAVPGATIRMCGPYIGGTDGFNLDKNEKPRTTTMHSVILVSKDDKGCVIYDSNINYGSTKNPDYRTRLRYYTWKEFAESFCSSMYFKYIKWPGASAYTDSIKVSTNGESNITNNSATISANLSQTVKLQEYGYIISTKKADVDVNITKSDNRKDTSTRDYVSNKSSESKNSCSITVNKILGKDLMPNTTYYYKIFIKANGTWFASGVGDFKTANKAPGASILSVSEANAHIGIGDAAAVSWTESANAKSYILNLSYDGTVVYTEKDVKGTTYAFPASCFDKAGEYEVKLSAVNEVKTVDMAETVTITVHDDVTVTFVDSVSGNTIETQQITYGHSASTPTDPSQYGYTFKGWDKTFDKVKENITVNTLFEANEYTVKFVDGVTGKVYKTEKVKFNTAAVAPSVSELNISNGYEFVAWDKDFSAIQGDTTVSSVYKWYNDNYPLATTLDVDDDGYADAARNEDKNGYDITVKVKNVTDEVVKGRLVVALKTETGYQYAETESSAFSISAGSEKEISVFILSDILAYEVEVYTINDYQTSGVLATSVSEKIDNSGAWSAWTAYTESVPVVEGENNVTHVETREVVSPTLYRYKTKETTTSYATSMTGWTQNGYTLEKSGSGTLNYVKSWPSGFYKSNSLYTKYNKTPVKASETTTTKVVINSDKASGKYIYWHWCRGRKLSDGPYNSLICDGKDGDWDTFHAFESSTYKSAYESGATYCKYSNSGVCTDSYYWWHAPITIRTQTYTTYKKLYNYYKWTDWSEYSETDPRTSALVGKTEGTDYEIEVVTGTTIHEYRYKTADLVAEDISVPETQIKDISGTVDTVFAGKEATVFVHKYTQPSDFTTEYVGVTTVGVDGSIKIEDAKLREALAIETGDFKVVASIEGNTGLIELQSFEAPKPQYTVTFYDYDEDGAMKKVIYRAVVEQGETVTAPSNELLTIPEGYKFARWSQSTVNVNGNLNVYPEIEAEEYVVVFVDWGSRDVTLVEMAYGEIIEPPTAAKAEGQDVTWDMSNATAVEETLDDGTTKTNYIVTQNTVITTQYDEKEFTTIFIKPVGTAQATLEKKDEILKGEEPAEDEIIEEDTPYGDHVDTPSDIEENPDYIFYGWKNIDTGEYLTDTTAKENATYYPVYEFAYTVDAPVADIKSGEYDDVQTVTLTCETENAVIWYTTDGSDPVTSETAVEYIAPIEISKACVLKFYAVSLAMNDSVVCSEVYAINNSTVYYYVFTVNTNIPAQGNAFFQALIKENAAFDESMLGTFEGYTYEGLFYDEEYTDEYIPEDEYAYESTTLYAKYTPNTYSISFVDYDGSILSTQQVEYSESATPPEVAEREGYVFVGWDSDEYQCVSGDGTYTAKYVAEDEYARISFKRKSTKKAAGSEFDVGKLAVITPEELSDTAISWSTNNSDVATVDHNGKVTLISAGKAVITATVDSSGESADFIINVTQDTDNSIVLGAGSYLGLDDSGYIRGLKPVDNTVAEVKTQFVNYDPDVTEDLADTKLVFVNTAGNELADDGLVGTGTVVNLMEISTGEILDSKVFIVSGDFDGDGNVTNPDVARISRYLVDKEEANLYQMLAIDVNGDGYINNRDASMVSRYLVGKESL